MKFLKGCLAVFGGLFLLLIVLGIIIAANQTPEERAAAEREAQEVSAKLEADQAAKKNQKQKETAAKETAKKAALTTITASQVLKAYDNNELKADKDYKGKRFLIKGVVTSIDAGLLEPYITLGSGAQFEVLSLQCFFKKSDSSKLAELNKGQTLTVQGTIDGRFMNVLVKDCSF